jgi:hypothetical protein
MAPVSKNRAYKAFIAQANASYRAAGLSEYQMRIKSDGSVDMPDHPKLGRGKATASARGAKAGAGSIPAGDAPALTQVTAPAPDTVQLTWNPVAGAVKYGIWQDGTLIGTVPNPQFTATIAPGSSSTIAIDAELPSGTRSPRTPAVNVSRAGDAAVQASVGNDAAAAQGTPAPAAPADAAAGAAQTATAPAAAAH